MRNELLYGLQFFLSIGGKKYQPIFDFSLDQTLILQIDQMGDGFGGGKPFLHDRKIVQDLATISQVILEAVQ